MASRAGATLERGDADRCGVPADGDRRRSRRRAPLRGPRSRSSGYAHLLAYDHVLGADPAAHAPWHGPYDVDTTFHEPFVLFGYLAACTSARAGHRESSSCRSARPRSSPSRPPRSTCSPTAGSASASGSAGTRSSTRRSASRLRRPRPRACREQIELLRRLLDASARSPTTASTSTSPAAGLAPLPVQRPDPDLDRRRSRRAGLPPRRPARRRLVPAGAARDRELDDARAIVADAAPRTRAAIRRRSGMEGRVSWTDRRRRQARRPRRPLAATRAPRTCRSTR